MPAFPSDYVMATEHRECDSRGSCTVLERPEVKFLRATRQSGSQPRKAPSLLRMQEQTWREISVRSGSRRPRTPTVGALTSAVPNSSRSSTYAGLSSSYRLVTTSGPSFVCVGWESLGEKPTLEAQSLQLRTHLRSIYGKGDTYQACFGASPVRSRPIFLRSDHCAG
jgi:hypothetical protein